MTERTKCIIYDDCIGCGIHETQKIDAKKIEEKLKEMEKTHK